MTWMPCDKPFSLRLFESGEVDERRVDSPITIVTASGRRSVCLRTVPVYVYEVDDRAAESLCIAALSSEGGRRRNYRGHLRLSPEHGRSSEKATGGTRPSWRRSRSTRSEAPLQGDTRDRRDRPAREHPLERAGPRPLGKERTGVSLSQSHVRRLARESRPVGKEVPLLDAPAEEVTEP